MNFLETRLAVLQHHYPDYKFELAGLNGDSSNNHGTPDWSSTANFHIVVSEPDEFQQKSYPEDFFEMCALLIDDFETEDGKMTYISSIRIAPPNTIFCEVTTCANKFKDVVD